MKKENSRHFILDRSYKLSYIQKIKKIKYYIEIIIYRIVFMFCKVKTTDKKYKVSICAIFKNESLYLKEWLEFNHIIGIEHFYLYNNNSEDDYLTVLQPYIDKGLVTLVQWPKNQAQMECYNHCIENFKGETNWLGFIDIDEFIIPRSKDNIYDILKPFEKKRGSVKIYWKMFGTSGKIKRNVSNLVTEDFTVCWPKYYIIGKCFYNTSFDFNFHSHHNKTFHHSFWANYRGLDIPPVNAFDKICINELDQVKNENHPIQINHYFTKSYDEYRMKRAKGDVFFKINPHDEEYFYLHENENLNLDVSAYKYLIKLKLNMNDDL